MPLSGSRPKGARRPSHAGAFHVIFLWLLAFASLALASTLFLAPRAPVEPDTVSTAPAPAPAEGTSEEEEEGEGEEEERTTQESNGLAGDFDGRPAQTWLHGLQAYLVNGWPAILPRAHTSVDLEQDGKPPRA